MFVIISQAIYAILQTFYLKTIFIKFGLDDRN